MNVGSSREVLRLGLGVLLVVLGLLFLAAQLFDINVWRYSWPLFVIVPGLLFFVGMVLGGRDSAALAIPGSIITTVGLILLYQNTSNHWQSWAYAWALIFPTSIGVGQMIQGVWSNQEGLVRGGMRLAGIGLVILLVGFVFFELVLNISGFGRTVVGKILGPLLLVAIGVYLLLRRGGRPSGSDT